SATRAHHRSGECSRIVSGKQALAAAKLPVFAARSALLRSSISSDSLLPLPIPMASSPTASRPAPENPQPAVAAWQIARLRAALDWMLCHPDWEGGIALSIAGLGLQGRRQGITGRKAALSLPIQHKCEAVRHALSSGLEAPRLEEALKLARLWGLTSFRAPSGLTQLPRKRWETLSGALLLRVAARASDYKRAQNA